MASPGAPVGNQNAAKARVWTEAIYRALDRKAEKDGRARSEVLADYADGLLQACDERDLTAIQELGNRLEGRPMQRIEADTRIEIEVTWKRDEKLWAVIEQESAPAIDPRIAAESPEVQDHLRLILSEIPASDHARVFGEVIETVRAAAARGEGERPPKELQDIQEITPMLNLDAETEAERAKFEDALAKANEHNAKVKARQRPA